MIRVHAKEELSKSEIGVTYSALILSLLPILYPYAVVGAVPLNVALLILSAIVLVFFRTIINAVQIFPLIILFSSHLFLSLIALFSWNYSTSLVFSMISTSISIIAVSVLWSRCNFAVYFKFANFIGICSVCFLYIQAIMLVFNLEPLSGRLPFLQLLDYASFVSSTWGFRLNSIFQEPSYFAIYCLPLYAINLSKSNMKIALLYAFALILSSSSLGIIGAVVITIYHFLFEKKSLKKLVLIFFSGIFVHLILYSFSLYYKGSINRSIDKVMMLSDESSIRFVGQAYLFDYLALFNQLFGVGINQMQNYFSGYDDVYNYSNSFIVTLINSGVFGLIFYVVFLIYSVFYSKVNNRIVFSLILIMVASIDYFIYTPLFFYILSFIYLKQKEGTK